MSIMTSILIVILNSGPVTTDGVASKPKPLPAKPDFEPYMLLGRAQAVTLNAVTLKPEGDFKIKLNANENGIQVERLYVQDNSKPARTFIFSDALLDLDGLLPPLGKVGLNKPRRWCEHKISDLRVGDLVCVEYRKIQGVDTCIRIRIWRHPGGLVPEAIADGAPEVGVKFAARMNAKQFVEERLAGKWVPRLFHGVLR